VEQPLMPVYAMRLASLWHKSQKRKYTGTPYFTHLAEVAATTATVLVNDPARDDALCVAWLHDCMEDQGKTVEDLNNFGFNSQVVSAVLSLSDLEQGNRAQRKALARIRLAKAPYWVQTIKCADLWSNIHSIIEHDPNFARVFIQEALQLVEVMTLIDSRLRVIFLSDLGTYRNHLGLST